MGIIRFRNDWETVYSRLINQPLRFPLTSEHDDAPDALEGAGSTCEVIGTGRGQAVSGGRGRVLRGCTSLPRTALRSVRGHLGDARKLYLEQAVFDVFTELGMFCHV